jgi:2-polyprenyl-3-methyl-5-hydroxy-6-metoxy-1,4-benzoquinol methylase
MALSDTDITDWNQNAEAYASTVGVPGDRLYAQFREVLWESLGDVAGQNILELGCGHGWLTQMLSDRNGRVTAIDGSTALLSRAKATCSNARFLCHDLTAGLPKLDGPFDLVVAYMVLMDLPVLDSLFRDVQAVSHPGTRLIVTINHPCFFFADIEQDSQSGSWFRKVTTYLSHKTWHIPSFRGHNHYHRPLTFY